MFGGAKDLTDKIDKNVYIKCNVNHFAKNSSGKYVTDQVFLV